MDKETMLEAVPYPYITIVQTIFHSYKLFFETFLKKTKCDIFI